jgi:hypothetical protein
MSYIPIPMQANSLPLLDLSLLEEYCAEREWRDISKEGEGSRNSL